MTANIKSLKSIQIVGNTFLILTGGHCYWSLNSHSLLDSAQSSGYTFSLLST